MNKKARDREKKESGSMLCDDMEVFLSRILLPLEIRVHGRGGQGGVTCAKLCALIYSRMELFAQTFGDYGMERAGAPVRALNQWVPGCRILFEFGKVAQAKFIPSRQIVMVPVSKIGARCRVV